MKKLFAVGLSAMVLMAVVAPFAFAQIDVQGPPGAGSGAGAPTDLQTVGGVIRLFEKVLTWVSIIFWIFAVLFILYAAFLYLTAAGDPEKVKKASSQLLYAVIAIIVALMATVIPTLVQSFLNRT